MEPSKQDMGPERGGVVLPGEAWGKTGEHEGSMHACMCLQQSHTEAEAYKTLIKGSNFDFLTQLPDIAAVLKLCV